MPPSNFAAARNLYNRDSVLSASPARLLVMLYDRLLLDLARAETAQLGEDWPLASAQLLHAQEIVTELVASLRPEAGTGAPACSPCTTTCSSGMAQANVRRDVGEDARVHHAARAAAHRVARSRAQGLDARGGAAEGRGWLSRFRRPHPSVRPRRALGPLGPGARRPRAPGHRCRGGGPRRARRVGAARRAADADDRGRPAPGERHPRRGSGRCSAASARSSRSSPASMRTVRRPQYRAVTAPPVYVDRVG